MSNRERVKVLVRKSAFQLGLPILVGTISIAVVSSSDATMGKVDKADVYYAQAAFPPEPADSPDNGQGTETDPFRSLKNAELASGPGDIMKADE